MKQPPATTVPLLGSSQLASLGPAVRSALAVPSHPALRLPPSPVREGSSVARTLAGAALMAYMYVFGSPCRF
ncbi:MAG: hypothetical protein M0Z42_12495 [Actinomycetota bacterium]|nr:hypothetical protein [Actinomycetota bacterium]